MFVFLMTLLVVTACSKKPIYEKVERAEMVNYYANPFETEVEWIVNFNDTAQMALNCEVVLISVEDLKNGQMKLSLKSKTTKK